MQNKQWKPGDWHLINKLYWGQPELDQVNSVLENDWFGGTSKANLEYENKLKLFSGFKYIQSVNSGSAAIELAIQALLQSGKLLKGDRVLHPTLTFPTSISSAIMGGLIPVFVDVGKNTFVIDTDKAIDAIKLYKPKLAILPALLGNVPDLDKLLPHLEGMYLIIDSCDVMGSKFNNREAATYATIAAYSTYGSHHISTAGVGGAVATNDDEIFKYIQSMTFWGRKFDPPKDTLANFLTRYTYDTWGLDAQLSAIQAAFGIAQLDRLPEYIGKRKAIFKRLQRLFATKMRYFGLPTRTSDHADISWFCYPVIIRNNAPFTRDEFAQYMLDNKVEIRPIFCNILDQQMWNSGYYRYSLYSTIENTIEATNHGFFIPACPMSEEQENDYIDIISKFLNKY